LAEGTSLSPILKRSQCEFFAMQDIHFRPTFNFFFKGCSKTRKYSPAKYPSEKLILPPNCKLFFKSSYFCFRVNPSSACTWRTVRINLFQTLYSSNTVETSLLWVSILFLFNFFYDAKWSLCQTCLSFILGPCSLSRYMGLFAMSFRVIQKPVRCHGLAFLSSFLGY